MMITAVPLLMLIEPILFDVFHFFKLGQGEHMADADSDADKG